HILLVGDSSRHQEVIGTRGEAPEHTTLVRVITQEAADAGLADPRTVSVPDPERVVVLTQTTLSVDDTDRTIEVLRERFPRLVTPSRDDLCFATKNRQAAVKALAGKVDLFLVVTSAHSSNGMRLAELAAELAPRAERVESAADLRPEWFSGVRAVGITSAASTPDDLVQDIVAALKQASPGLAVTEEGEDERVSFRRPERHPAPRG
ncbi:MAG TPA: 4-hydroxy-3-methylbut-2-enyl diphosphate reductase, partial [Deinococcales bacterium]|nr:4-hydroxy-3-methylbut-2-enyl diphosphate reductase [Deinococcales bacterium]